MYLNFKIEDLLFIKGSLNHAPRWWKIQQRLRWKQWRICSRTLVHQKEHISRKFLDQRKMIKYCGDFILKYLHFVLGLHSWCWACWNTHGIKTQEARSLRCDDIWEISKNRRKVLWYRLSRLSVSFRNNIFWTNLFWQCGASCSRIQCGGDFTHSLIRAMVSKSERNKHNSGSVFCQRAVQVHQKPRSIGQCGIHGLKHH